MSAEDARTVGERVEDVYTRAFERFWRTLHGDAPIPEGLMFALRERARAMRIEIDSKRGV